MSFMEVVNVQVIYATFLTAIFLLYVYYEMT